MGEIIMDKAYIKRKIENCKNLIENATSEAQRLEYLVYLEFWEAKRGVKVYIDVDKAQLFEAEFPLRKAYYKRDGKQYKTKRFKEYLKNL